MRPDFSKKDALLPPLGIQRLRVLRLADPTEPPVRARDYRDLPVATAARGARGGHRLWPHRHRRERQLFLRSFRHREGFLPRRMPAVGPQAQQLPAEGSCYLRPVRGGSGPTRPFRRREPAPTSTTSVPAKIPSSSSSLTTATVPSTWRK